MINPALYIQLLEIKLFLPYCRLFHHLQTAMSTGNASNASNAVQKHAPPANVPVTAHMQKAIEHPMPILQPTPSLPASSNPLLPLLDTHKPGIGRNHATNPVNPSLFSMSSSLMMPPQQIQPSAPTAIMQQPYGTPLLQPFPPPTPPPSLTPISGPVITRDKVRDALMRLVQSDQFIDMVHRELLNAYNS